MVERRPVNLGKQTVTLKKSIEVRKEIKNEAEKIESKQTKLKKPILWTNQTSDLKEPIKLQEELANINEIQGKEKRRPVVNSWNKLVYSHGTKRKAETNVEKSVAKKPKTIKSILWTNEAEDLIEPKTLEEELAKIDRIQDFVRRMYDVDSYEHLKPPMKLKRRRY